MDNSVITPTYNMGSLRRTFMAGLVSVVLVYAGVTILRNRASLRSLSRAVGAGALGVLGAWVFVGFLGPLKLAPELVLGRVMSLNLAWAVGQADPTFGPTGHIDDFFDGSEAVIGNPILGQGLNLWFPLPRTSSWREGSVHAGVFLVWIKLGLLGLIAYLLLFWRGARCLLRGAASSVDAADLDLRLLVGWFSVHFLLVSVLMNSVLLGYKNSLVTAVYASISSLLLDARNSHREGLPGVRGTAGSAGYL